MRLNMGVRFERADIRAYAQEVFGGFWKAQHRFRGLSWLFGYVCDRCRVGIQPLVGLFKRMVALFHPVLVRKFHGIVDMGMTFRPVAVLSKSKSTTAVVVVRSKFHKKYLVCFIERFSVVPGKVDFVVHVCPKLAHLVVVQIVCSAVACGVGSHIIRKCHSGAICLNHDDNVRRWSRGRW